jgi:hypothetical protein
VSSIHQSWHKVGGVALEIMEGKHDDDLEHISNACGVRVKMMFPQNKQVRLVGTGNVSFEGEVGFVQKPHVKTVAVAIPGKGIVNVPPRMLEIVE